LPLAAQLPVLAAAPALASVGAAARAGELAQLLQSALFRLNTRRLGAVGELLVQRLTDVERSRSVHHDLYDARQGERIEVKFSTVLACWETALRPDTLEAVLREASGEGRAIASDAWAGARFDCNIQQVKPAEFDILYYGLFFADGVLLFRCTAGDVAAMPGWSAKQHKGNTGEGQFHLNARHLPYHLEHHFDQRLGYLELARLLFDC
jgi:hypothetical protein